MTLLARACREQQHRPAEALEDFRSVLRLEPGNKEARHKVEQLAQVLPDAAG